MNLRVLKYLNKFSDQIDEYLSANYWVSRDLRPLNDVECWFNEHDEIIRVPIGLNGTLVIYMMIEHDEYLGISMIDLNLLKSVLYRKTDGYYRRNI